MEKSMLEMTDEELLEHVREIKRKRDEQTVEKAVKKVREVQVRETKKKLSKVGDDPSMAALLDFFNEEKNK